MEVYRKKPNKPSYLHQQSVTRPKRGETCIVRRDGTKAVVTTEDNELEFFVFHPKCYQLPSVVVEFRDPQPREMLHPKSLDHLHKLPLKWRNGQSNQCANTGAV
ncbi:hypothetical protein B9Z55_007543 [Caenorhabditis nigoni]|uniref:Uncharacterized protein n=1 Tax=Caenorhabditis nigoni TaxID=1611254 RepID=A0A2G5VA33_9PELO|nr:hypothetical protein B9Z55_007543 [Caenorhabditis nigoni]